LTEGLACSAVEYARCKEHQAELSRDMAACFDEVDAHIMPATTGPAPDIKTTGDPAFNSPWSYTGLPVVSIPAGRTSDRMPLAIQLVGPRFGEAELFAAAAWCEAALGLDPVDPPIGYDEAELRRLRILPCPCSRGPPLSALRLVNLRQSRIR